MSALDARIAELQDELQVLQREKAAAAEKEAPIASAASERWLEHQATPEQLKTFEKEGYVRRHSSRSGFPPSDPRAGRCRQLVIEDALDPAEIARYTDAIDRLAAAEIAAGNSPDFGGAEAVYVNCQRGVIRDPAFLDLLDHPSTFPILWDLMGWNIREPSASGRLTECVSLTPAWLRAQSSTSATWPCSGRSRRATASRRPAAPAGTSSERSPHTQPLRSPLTLARRC